MLVIEVFQVLVSVTLQDFHHGYPRVCSDKRLTATRPLFPKHYIESIDLM